MTWRLKPDFMSYSAVIHDFGSPEGHATVECVINKRGQPDDCVVLEEDPSNRRLGKLVREMASRYRASTTDTAGAPTTGRKVRYRLGIGASIIP